MKKDRNAFFQNQSASSYFYLTNPVPTNPMMGAYPMATESSSNFYQGPIMTPMYGQQNQDNYSNELESRLAKIERQINRLDTRVSKLESEQLTTGGPTNDYTANNMYMV